MYKEQKGFEWKCFCREHFHHASDTKIPTDLVLLWLHEHMLYLLT